MGSIRTCPKEEVDVGCVAHARGAQASKQASVPQERRS